LVKGLGKSSGGSIALIWLMLVHNVLIPKMAFSLENT
jgi:hypothetical protein